MEKTSETNLSPEANDIYKNLCKKYGEYFNYMREKKGLSLRDLYKETNISIALLSLLENGEKLPRIETLIKLMLALDIPYDEIFGKKASDIEFNSSTKKQKSRTDEELRNILLKMNYDKDDVKEILEFAKFQKIKKAIKSHKEGSISNSAVMDLILNNGEDFDNYERYQDYDCGQC